MTKSIRKGRANYVCGKCGHNKSLGDYYQWEAENKEDDWLKMEIKTDYDEEYDMFFINFGGKVEHSRELFNGSLILDFNKNEEVVGFEISNFKERCEDSDKHITELLNSVLDVNKIKEGGGKW